MHTQQDVRSFPEVAAALTAATVVTQNCEPWSE